FRQRIVNAYVVFKPALVVDQLARNLDFLLADAIQRLDLAGVNDRRVEARLDGIVQKHGVQDDARGWIQTKGDVRHTEQRERARQFALDAFDSLDCLERVATIFFDTRRDRQREW